MRRCVHVLRGHASVGVRRPACLGVSRCPEPAWQATAVAVIVVSKMKGGAVGWAHCSVVD